MEKHSTNHFKNSSKDVFEKREEDVPASVLTVSAQHIEIHKISSCGDVASKQGLIKEDQFN